RAQGRVPDEVGPADDPLGREPRPVAAARRPLHARFRRPPARARRGRAIPGRSSLARPRAVLRVFPRRHRRRARGEPPDRLDRARGQADGAVRAPRRGRMTMAETDTPPASPADLDRVAARALALCAGARVIGLGSGRAATAFIRALGAEVNAGRSVRGVPTSGATARLARELGIPLAGLDEASPELTVDGADEVDPRLDLIKGYGGALVRERIVAVASERQIILVGPEKLVPVLGSHHRLPIEIVPFALPLAARRLAPIAGAPTLRQVDGRPFITDNGNLILDCAVGPSPDPERLENAI